MISPQDTVLSMWCCVKTKLMVLKELICARNYLHIICANQIFLWDPLTSFTLPGVYAFYFYCYC